MPSFRLRNCFRFSLRTLFVIVTLAAMPLFWLVRERAQSEREMLALNQLRPSDMTLIPWHETFTDEESWWHEPLDAICGPRVRSITISGNPLNDPAPLSELTSLNVLDISDSSFSDLRSLAKMPRLHFLALERVPVVDLTPLADIKSLEVLKLEATQVRDLAPLTRLPTLTILFISDAPIKNLSPIAELKELTMLHVTLPTVTDLKPFMKLDKLTYLDIAHCDVTDSQADELKNALPKCQVNLVHKEGQAYTGGTW